VLAGDHEIHEAREQERHAQPGDVEHAEAVSALRRHEAAHDDVGAGADERAEPSENDGVVHRHEKLRHAQAMLLRPVADGRDHECDHGRVVHEGREGRRRQHRPPLRRRQRRGAAQPPVDECRQCARALDGGGHYEQRGDRQHPLVAHAREGLARREDARRQQHHDAADHHHVGGPLAHEQQRECDQHDQRRQQGLPMVEE
jgi:hypothetical protein